MSGQNNPHHVCTILNVVGFHKFNHSLNILYCRYTLWQIPHRPPRDWNTKANLRQTRDNQFEHRGSPGSNGYKCTLSILKITLTYPREAKGFAKFTLMSLLLSNRYSKVSRIGKISLLVDSYCDRLPAYIGGIFSEREIIIISCRPFNDIIINTNGINLRNKGLGIQPVALRY